MALRDQPYFPLYVQDYLTDEKLNSCSAASQGVFIKILCIFHKSEPYGGILFKQKDKQNSSMCLNFAAKLAKLLPFDQETIFSAITELIEEGVLTVEGDFLYQKRMCRDFEISLARSKAAKKGGGNPNLFKQDAGILFKQKDKQNAEYENEYETVLKNNEYEEKTPVPFKPPEPPEILWADPTDPELTMVQEYLLKSPAAGKPAAGMLRGLWDNFKLEFETHFHLSRKDVIIHFCRSLALKDWSKKTAAAEGENVNRANNYLEHLKKNGQ